LLDLLGKSLSSVIRKISSTALVDERLVKEIVRDIQRALLRADVNVKLVLDLSKRIEERALKEDPPRGLSRKQHLIKIVYEEIVALVGEGKKIVPRGKPFKVLMIGIQGSGKTTSAIKLGRYYQKRGYKTGVICADTYRPGALDQLLQLGEKAGIEIYGERNESDPIKIVSHGLEKFRNFDLVLIDTAGRHKEEEGLLREMEELSRVVNPDEVMLVLDATIGQEAGKQAKAFHERAKVGSIFLSKMDGSAKGGGAISAVAETGAKVAFIGIGERIDDIEEFDPEGFVSRLLGMGDLKSLLQKAKEIGELEEMRRTIEDIMKGKFTLKNFYDQIVALGKAGPIKRIIQMIPGLSLGESDLEISEEKLRRYKAIIESMTREEILNPKIINRSRIRRIAKGSGTTTQEVKELLNEYFTVERLMRRIRKKGIKPRDLARLMRGMRV